MNTTPSVRLSDPAGRTLPITRKGRIGELMAWAITVIAWGLSFASQVALALEHGFHGFLEWEAAGMALISDLGAWSMMFLSLDQAERGRSAKLTWGISIAAAGMMEWANIVYAWPDPVAVILHAWPPALAFASVFVLVHIRRTNARPARGEVIEAAPVEPPAGAPIPAPAQPPEIADGSAGQAPTTTPAQRRLGADDSAGETPTEVTERAPISRRLSADGSAGPSAGLGVAGAPTGPAPGAPTPAPVLALVQRRKRPADSASKAAVRRLWKQHQRQGRLGELDGPLVQKRTGLSASRARELLAEVRREEEADAAAEQA